MTIYQLKGFQSFSEYRQFVFAREFCDRTHPRVDYAKTRLERFGDLLVYPVMKLADLSMMNIRNPVMIASIAITLILGVTILYYPSKLMQLVTRVIPVAKKIEPWMIKASLYTILQTTIAGIGLRAMGRLDKRGALWILWDINPRQIRPVSVGSQVVYRH